MPTSVAASGFATDRIALTMLALNLMSALVMTLVLATTGGDLPDSFEQHLDAAGLPDRWGTPRTLWRIPLIAIGATVMNATLAWFLMATDRFAGRFALAAALVVQLLAWIALLDYL